MYIEEIDEEVVEFSDFVKEFGPKYKWTDEECKFFEQWYEPLVCNTDEENWRGFAAYAKWNDIKFSDRHSNFEEVRNFDGLYEGEWESAGSFVEELVSYEIPDFHKGCVRWLHIDWDKTQLNLSYEYDFIDTYDGKVYVVRKY